MSAALTQRQAYEDFIASYRAAGKALAAYNCPNCGERIETPQPAKGDKFDSATRCHECGKMHFKIVYDDGRVETCSMEAWWHRRGGDS